MFKFLNKNKKKGQSTLEYAVLIVIIIAETGRFLGSRGAYITKQCIFLGSVGCFHRSRIDIGLLFGR